MSLCVEFLFYALFPLLARVTAGISRDYFIVLTYGLVLAMTIVRLNAFSPHGPLSPDASNFELFFPPFHVPQFIFGMALGRIYLFGPTLSPRFAAAMFWIGTLGLLLVFGLRSSLPWWTQADAALVLLFALTIIGGAASIRAVRML
jgi:peptidoglycan/LPS O-acetylase OafA/YrhL